MRNAKVWILVAFLMGALGGQVLVGTSSVAQPPNRAKRNYWRHHDGRWSHWDARDNRWYYTDGKHWFYHGGGGNKGWQLYRFDKTFGREGFERGNYVVPPPDATVVVPQHGIYVAPR